MIQAISKSMTAVEARLFPSVFKEGWLRVSKRSRSLLKHPRSAPCFCWNLRTTPSAPLRNGIFLLMAQPPLLEKEGNGPASQPPHPLVPKAFETVFIVRFNSFKGSACSPLNPRASPRHASRIRPHESRESSLPVLQGAHTNR